MISRSKIKVRYAETDQMGIAHHSNYPIWYEVARTDLMKKMGMTYTQIEEQGLIVPLLELQCKYISAAYFEDNLIVEASLKNATAVKLEFEYAIFREGDEKPLNVGRTLHALVGKDLRPVNVKKEYPELYQKLISAVENESPLLEEKKEE
ncbi:MAG: acyl-CoA thioesterase [Lachnospiraceae bacterium]|jgi:acyl-CoA thioester hydrolase|nr:acyl-CoA thioesterase [Lachnospiraceae bacterium]